MKKAWIYKRKSIKGWWVGWYESGKRKAKALPTRKLAEHYCQLKYSQLWKPGMKIIVVSYCKTPNEQQELYNIVHEMCQ